MNELDELLGRLGSALDDGLDGAGPRAADQARTRLSGAIHGESAGTGGPSGRRGSLRPRHRGRWSRLVVIGLSVTVTLAVLAVALGTRGHRPMSSAAVPTRLPFGSRLNPSGPTGVIAGSVALAAVVRDPEGSGPAWGLKIYRVRGDMTCFQAGREESGQIGAVGAYGSFGDDGRFHPFTFSDVGFGTCVPNDAEQHAFANRAYANAPASASGEPCQIIPGRVLPRLPARVREHLAARSHAADCESRNQRLVAFGLLGPDATSITYRTAHGTTTIRPRGPDGAYLIVEPVDPAICGTQCGYSSRGSGTSMSLPDGLIKTITYRDAPTCYGPPLTGRPLLPLGPRVRSEESCRDVGYVAPAHARVTEANVASRVSVRSEPARGASLLTVDVSWIARQPVTDVNDSAYAIQVTNPRRCGGGGQGGGTDSLIAPGTRVTREVQVSSRCAGTYRGTVVYEPSLGPAGQDGIALPQPGTPGVFLVGRFSFVVR